MHSVQQLSISTMKYISPRIQGYANAMFYRLSMIELIDECQKHLTYSDAISSIKIQQAYVIENKDLKDGWFFQERKYRLLAYTHITDILLSLDKKYNGGSNETYCVYPTHRSH